MTATIQQQSQQGSPASFDKPPYKLDTHITAVYQSQALQCHSIGKKKTVSFQKMVNVRLIEPTPSLISDPSELWFQEQDYTMIQRMIVGLLKKVDHEGKADGNKYWDAKRIYLRNCK